jgi:hypothetical protein
MGIFDGAMSDFSRQETAALLASYDFSDLSHLVDVGGGRGELLQTVLRAHGHLRGTLFDQPAVVAPVTVPADLAPGGHALISAPMPSGASASPSPGERLGAGHDRAPSDASSEYINAQKTAKNART